MAITFPRPLPAAPGFSRARFRFRSAAALTQSPFSYGGQTQAHSGQIWAADLDLPTMRREQADEWVSWLVSLNGPVGTFLLGDPDAKTPRGSAATTPGVPVVDGAGQSGEALSVRGLPVSAAGYLLNGSYFQVGSGSTARFHRLLEDVDSDGSGNATFTFKPAIRSAPADGAAIVVANTVGLFRLPGSQFQWDTDQVSNFGVSFSVIEAL